MRTSYWHTVVTRLPNAIMAYSSKGVPFGENRSPVRKIPVALVATVTSRFMRTRKMDAWKNSGGDSSLPPPYGMVISRSCSTPYMHSDTNTPRVQYARFAGVRYRRDVRVATWGIRPSVSLGGFAPRAPADLDRPKPAPYMSAQDPMKNPFLCLNHPRLCSCLGDLAARASSSSPAAPSFFFSARFANSSSAPRVSSVASCVPAALSLINARGKHQCSPRTRVAPESSDAHLVTRFSLRFGARSMEKVLRDVQTNNGFRP